MFGNLIGQLDTPEIAARLMARLDDAHLAARLDASAAAAGETPAEHLATTVRSFLDRASDDHWVQLLGIIRRSPDPGLAAIRAVLAKSLPDTAL